MRACAWPGARRASAQRASGKAKRQRQLPFPPALTYTVTSLAPSCDLGQFTCDIHPYRSDSHCHSSSNGLRAARCQCCTRALACCPATTTKDDVGLCARKHALAHLLRAWEYSLRYTRTEHLSVFTQLALLRVCGLVCVVTCAPLACLPLHVLTISWDNSH